MHENIRNSHLLTDIFGKWPSFHDAEVASISLDRMERGRWEPTLRMDIYLFEMTSEVDASGYFKLRNQVIVSLIFHSIVNIELRDFNQQNVLFGLEISEQRTPEFQGFEVSMDSSYGLSGQFRCGDIEVAGVKPIASREAAFQGGAGT